MDDMYIVSYIIFNKEEYYEIQKEFDTLTEAIARVNEIANSDKYRYMYILIKWGDSRIFELYGD